MQLNHLHAFLALAQDLNFRQAALRLCLSQPALTAQIADLERDLEVQLFDRDRSGTRLTGEGLALLPLARRTIAAAAEIEPARRTPGYRRQFRVGLMEYGIGELTWPVLQAFHETRPDLELNVVRTGFDDVMPWLGSGAIDVLLAVGPFGEDEASVSNVGAIPLCAAVSRRHPRADSDAIDAGWLAGHLTLRPPPGVGKTFAAFWTLQDVGGPPLERLRGLDPTAGIDELLLAVARGAVGVWPSLLQTSNSVRVLP